MGEQVVHFDAHVASKVSKSSQHLGNKFFIVPGLVVAKEVVDNLNKSLPRMFTNHG